MNLTIHALHVGTLTRFPTSAMLFGRRFGEQHDVAMLMFVILGGPHPVVVDTGPTSPARASSHHPGFQLHQPAALQPEAALQRLGVDPSTVRTVIHTHLHWDHAGNDDLFPSAQILVQRDELHYAIAPLAPSRAAYENSPTVAPVWLDQLRQVRPLDGDMEVFEKLRVIHLPGHTPGSQGVLVDTDAGRYLIAGDNVPMYDSIEDPDVFVPNGAFTNLHDYERTHRRIRELNCSVIPSHDLRVLERQPFGQP